MIADSKGAFVQVRQQMHMRAQRCGYFCHGKLLQDSSAAAHQLMSPGVVELVTRWHALGLMRNACPACCTQCICPTNVSASAATLNSLCTAACAV
jgi:hypothetical protein